MSATPPLRRVEHGPRIRRRAPVVSRVALAVVGAGAIAASCRPALEPGPELSLAIVSGDAQRATVGETLAQPLTVRVVESRGRTVYGVTVEFAVTSGGGTVDQAATVIGSTGVASTLWTLGTSTTASHRVVARAVDPRSGSVADTVIFSATALPDVPVAVVKVSGDSQVGDIGGSLTQPLTVRVVDQYGNGVSGRAVTWSVTNAALGGALYPASGWSGADGLAGTTWTLGPRAGTTFGARAAAGFPQPVLFTATSGSTLAATARLTVLGDSQTVMVGSATAESVGVQITVSIPTDTPTTAPVAGLAVTFSVTAGGGSITPSTVTTDGNGIARTRWIVGSTPGTNTATASAGGRSAVMRATAVDPTLTAIADSQSAYVGTSPSESVGVLVRAGCCSGVAGVDVSFAVTSGGGSITPATVRTDQNGLARVAWVLGGTPGVNTATASLTASLGSRSVTLTARAVQPVAVAAAAAGGAHTCAITTQYTIYCWGWNASGQLGDGTTTNRSTPVEVVGVALSSLVAGSEHTCGFDGAGMVFCWGRNAKGQLGDGTTSQRSVPAPVTQAPPLFSLTAGAEHTCGLTAAGAAYCWGNNWFGQLGDSTASDRTSPVAVAGGRVFTKLVAGFWHTCGLTAAGDVYCWGDNGSGQIGASSGTQTCAVPSGSTSCLTVPTRVPTTLVFSDLAGGAYHACALAGSSAYCWGEGSPSLEPPPYQPVLARFASGFSWGFNCAATAGGQPYCWDFYWYNYYRWVSQPYPVPGALSYETVTMGTSNHACGVTVGSRFLYCWGNNGSGQLGDGSTQPRGSPSPVLIPAP